MTESDKLKRLRVARGQYKGTITRIDNFFNDASSLSSASVDILEARKEKLITTLKDYEKIQMDILSIAPDDEEQVSVIEDKYYSVLAKINNALKNLNVTTSNCHNASTCKLPNIEIPIFDGRDFTKFKPFFDLFMAVIDQNNSLSNVQRLFYLRKYLHDDALAVIINLPLVNESYNEAIQLLKKRFDNKSRLIANHIGVLLDIPTMQKGTAASIRAFVSQINQQLHALKNLKEPVDKWNMLLISILTRKLDQITNRAYQLDRDSDNMPSMDSFIDYLEKRAIALEDSSQNRSTYYDGVTKYFPNKSTPYESTYKSTSKVSNVVTKPLPPCRYCLNKDHQIYNCPMFKMLPVSQRQSYVTDKDMCKVCLNNHDGKCKFSFKCKLCKQGHNTLLHLEKEAVSNIAQQQPSTSSDSRTSSDGGGDGTLDMGSRSSLHAGLHMSEDEHWEMNYHEAAIYLEVTSFHPPWGKSVNGEGLNNEKFDSHPSSPEELPAYLRVHNPWYHGLDLLASLVLILLAFTEDPAVKAFKMPVWAHGTIELMALMVIGVELHLKLKWIGWSTILKHKRTMIKGVTLLIMVLEAVVVLCRESSHFRVTRALRPIFLVDTRYCGGVRRFIRQILQSLPPILDMLGLLMFFVATYSLLGYYLFSEHLDNGHFSTLSDSFVSMFVLLTTANFPDVMMPSYAKSQWYALFFILYIITVLYVLMNLMLAVVYETFTRIEREKCRALLLHRRRAARHAFRLLVSRRAPDAVRLRHFVGLMRHYAPHYSGLDVYLMFKQLNQSGSGGLSRAEFANLYEVFALRWAGQAARAPWYADSALEPAARAAARLLKWRYFEHVIYSLIVANGVAMVLRVAQAGGGGLQHSARLLCASWDTWLFLSLFLVEAALRMMASGASSYLESGWNVFDLSVTLLALMGAVMLTIAPKLFIVVIFRPLRLMRLYKLKKRYRDVFGTLVLLTPLMSSAGCVMLVMYYFFAIIGMELFAELHLRGCCLNTTVEDFYKVAANGSTALGYYYLNNFDDLITSGVTLFELTVVNNWFILMNAYAIVAGQFSRLYFMVFYLFTMVVLTIVVASVLEAFRFRIQYKRSTTKRDEEKLLHEEVHTSWEEATRLGAGGELADELRPYLPAGSEVTFIGSRPRTKEVLQRRMYNTDIQKWLAEEDENEGVPPSTTLTSSEDPLAPPLIQQPESENDHQLRPGYQL